MKKIVVAIALAVTAPAAFALGQAAPSSKTTQAQPSLEQRAEAITAGFTKNLRLTPQQTQKVYAINLTSLQHAEKAREKYKNNPKKLVSQMDMISQTRLSQLKDVLTPQQFQQYQQRREEKMGVPREAQSNPAARQQSPLNQESY
ncbi:hypothetical protein POKO110462_03045 [Pontibacter korlensis]|uniref:DUF4890 domain-containing protein n=1 Tax=Pontibacter korlensis TaxID=400092 RepID=A0A0E3ZG35_9BACT|nr:hypothetical protein [Pontibacter korlensis]AKD03899.1 hypothetical protein PKOR_13250 [Pontibacter korlensis]